MGRLYLPHRETKDQERDKESGKTGCGSWGGEASYDDIKNMGLFHYNPSILSQRNKVLKVHKIENFFGSEFEFYTILLLVMLKY
jgi:hypothetical protein